MWLADTYLLKLTILNSSIPRTEDPLPRRDPTDTSGQRVFSLFPPEPEQRYRKPNLIFFVVLMQC
jgi:hypothetical protein